MLQTYQGQTTYMLLL